MRPKLVSIRLYLGYRTGETNLILPAKNESGHNGVSPKSLSNSTSQLEVNCDFSWYFRLPSAP